MAIRSASDLYGVFPAFFTPLLKDDPKRLRNKIDYDKAELMIEDLIEAGVRGVVPVGTTGQSATLSHQQHLDFIRFVIEHVNGRIEVIAGAGSNCTRESIEMIEKVLAIKEVPLLCVTGYYNNPPQEGIRQHFTTIARETGAKIVLYNVPGRTCNYMTPETVIALAHEPNIIGIKQAVNFKPGGPHRDDTLKIAEATKGVDFTLLTGEDDAIFDVMKMGGKGVISASANIPEVAKIMVELVRAGSEERWELARSLQDDLAPYVEACFCRKNPIPLGFFFNSPLYQPLVSLNETEGGEALAHGLRMLINEKAPSLLKYH